ncbi:MAG: DmsE family decaheme c-type cytochrome [Fimbriimonadaceae bacterium]|nr:DmsE family decaheme c-type cytochrome [Fimbriimonadaceae bacterium]
MRPVCRVGGVALAVTLASLVPLLGPRPVQGDEAEAAQPVGSETCLECHAQYAPAWGTTRHNANLQSEKLPPEQRGCEGCHGPGSKHLEDPEFRNIRHLKTMVGLPAVRSCLACHGTDIKAPLWLNTSHAKAGLGCGGCHDTHNEPKGPYMLKNRTNELCLSCHPDQAAEFRMNSHHPVLEKRMDCSDCHDPHQAGAGAGALLKAGNDSCVRCHLEKRGPFVFEHATSTGTGDEGCMTCHRPHGSPNPKLGEMFGNAICLQCHGDIAADPAHLPRAGSCYQAGCHSRLHGSNVNRLLIQ